MTIIDYHNYFSQIKYFMGTIAQMKPPYKINNDLFFLFNHKITSYSSEPVNLTLVKN